MQLLAKYTAITTYMTLRARQGLLRGNKEREKHKRSRPLQGQDLPSCLQRERIYYLLCNSRNNDVMPNIIVKSNILVTNSSV